MNRARNQIAELQAERKVLADKLKKIPGMYMVSYHDVLSQSVACYYLKYNLA